ncbi:MAG: hypothetical protein ACT4TC_09865, partial [Myxococcaceae bacterium]
MNRLLPLWVAAFVLALTGCTKPQAELAPRVLSFAATPAALEQPGNVTLSWETQNATSVVIRDGQGQALPGVGDLPAGAIEVDVTSDTLFVLSARNARGVGDVAVAPVTLSSSVPPKGISFVATPSRIAAGELAVLAWSAPGAKSVRLVAAGGEALELNGQVSSGTVKVSPQRTTTYELTAGTLKRAITLLVGPTITAFTSTPAAARPGEPLSLSWKTAGATRVKVLTSAGREVANETSLEEVRSGSLSVAIPASTAPTEIFSYVLLAEAEGLPSVHKDLSVYVAGQPRFLRVTAPSYGVEGGDFTLSWETAEADLVRLSVDGVPLYESTHPALATRGALQVKTPAKATTFTLTAVNTRGGTVSQLRTVAPVPKTHLNAFSANPPSGIAKGGSPVTLSWNVTGARRLKISVPNQYTVFTQEGVAAEVGSLQVYPNENTDYALAADNTVGDSVSDRLNVAVAAPEVFIAPTTATLQGNPVPLTTAAAGPIWGMAHFDVVHTAASSGFVDIQATGTRLIFEDVDEAVTGFTPADFETWIFGARAAGPISVAIDGYFVFADLNYSYYYPTSIPSQGNKPFFTAPYYGDLQLSPGGGVFWEVRGDAPNRVLIVQWQGLLVKGDPASSLTFQAQLHQTGVVTFEYKTLVTSIPATATIGVQGGSARQGLQYTARTPVAGSRLTFFGPKSPPVDPVLQIAGPYVGWVERGSAFLKLSHTSSTFVSKRDLSFSELLFAPAPVIATTGEWMEVSNQAAVPVDLAGWTLDFGGGQQHIIDPSRGITVVPAGGLLLLGQSKAPTENDGVNVQYVYGPSLTLSDSTPTASLSKGNYAIISALSSGQGGAGVSAASDTG